MAEESSLGQDERSARQRTSEHEHQPEHDLASEDVASQEVAYPSRLINSDGLAARGNAPVRSSIMQNMQKTHGNLAVQRFMQRSASAEQGEVGEEKPVQRSFLDALTGELPSFGGIGAGIGVLGGAAAGGISGLGHMAGGFGRDIYSDIGGAIAGGSALMGNGISSIGNGIFGEGSAFGDIAGIAGGAVSGIGATFGGAVSHGGGNLMSMGESLIDNSASGVSSIASGLGSEVAGLGDLPPETWQM